MDKKLIRKRALEKRNSLTKEEIAEKSLIIKQKLFSSEEYKQAKTISCYVSIGSEVETHDMIKQALKDGKKVCVPILQGGSIIMSLIEDFNELNTRDEFGILEPYVIRKVELDKVDLVIAPCVAFDKYGHRIGHGKRYYDRLLDGYKGKKIALAFSEQMIDKIPNESHDVKMDMVVSD